MKKLKNRKRRSMLHALFALVFLNTLVAQPAHARRDERGGEATRNTTRTDADSAGDARGDAGGLMRGAVTRDTPAMSRMQTAANSIAERTGLTNPALTTGKIEGGAMVYRDNKTGEAVMEVRVDEAGKGTVTLFQQNEANLPATIGTQVGGETHQAQVDLHAGPMTFNITPQSAQQNLAATMTMSGAVLQANAGAFAAISPGGTNSLDNVGRVENAGTTNFSLTVSANPMAPAGQQNYITASTKPVEGAKGGFAAPVAGAEGPVAEAPDAPESDGTAAALNKAVAAAAPILAPAAANAVAGPIAGAITAAAVSPEKTGPVAQVKSMLASAVSFVSNALSGSPAPAAIPAAVPAAVAPAVQPAAAPVGAPGAAAVPVAAVQAPAQPPAAQAITPLTKQATPEEFAALERLMGIPGPN